MAFNFKGGIHPDDRKQSTYKKPIEELDAPRELVFPMLMHKGQPCEPIVEVGAHVRLGQKIAESEAAPIHCSVSGRVTAVEPRLSLSGEEILSIVVENDFEDEAVSPAELPDEAEELSAEALAELVRDAGIVGLGGSVKPLADKILASVGKVSVLIINGAECEPYITADNRMMVEYSEELHDGAMLIARALGIREVTLAIESDKPHAIAEMRRVFTKKTGVKLEVVHTKYPQGAERQIIRAVTGREVPPGGLPSDIGILTVNVSTAVAVARAVRERKPLYERVVTVSGSAVANPKNLLVRIGTPIKELFSYCGGFLEHPERIIAGGPLMGITQFSLDAPVIKGTNAVLAFSKGEDKPAPETTCIRCGKCVGVCPMRLLPLYIYRDYKKGKINSCVSLHVSDCTECGCCSYICPARIPLTAAFGVIKEKLAAEGEGENEA